MLTANRAAERQRSNNFLYYCSTALNKRGEIMLKANRVLKYWHGFLGGLRKQEKSISQMSRAGTVCFSAILGKRRQALPE